jgi:hypothetical protein
VPVGKPQEEALARTRGWNRDLAGAERAGDPPPAMPPTWMRSPLTERGPEERWSAPAEEAVATFAPAFRKAVTDRRSFGHAKAVTDAMLATGVDLPDQDAVARWIAQFNERPIQERDVVLGPLALPWQPKG